MSIRKPALNIEKLIDTPFDSLLDEFPHWSRNHLLRVKKAALRKLDFDERMRRDANMREESSYREKYKIAVDKYQDLNKILQESFKIKRPLETLTIKPSEKEGTGEAVAFMVASDWHVEEPVFPGQVNGLNEFNLEIAESRVKQFFQNGLKLFNMTARDVEIKTIVLALLGDYITSSIHDEGMESNQLSPGDALWKAQNLIASGIQYLLDNTDCELIIPCAAGNHSRMTKEQRHGTEQGNSLETLMYRNLALYFEKEKRVKFIISEGYHIYLDIFGYVIRLHHGHAIKYGGGVGGITISVNKAIAQWNRAKPAYLDIFGHLHQFFDGGNFIANGSLIGYNAYAVAIKAAFEKPKQTYFLLDKKRGKTVVAPILFE